MTSPGYFGLNVSVFACSKSAARTKWLRLFSSVSQFRICARRQQGIPKIGVVRKIRRRGNAKRKESPKFGCAELLGQHLPSPYERYTLHRSVVHDALSSFHPCDSAAAESSLGLTDRLLSHILPSKTVGKEFRVKIQQGATGYATLQWAVAHGERRAEVGVLAPNRSDCLSSRFQC